MARKEGCIRDYQLAGRSVYAEINLDVIAENLKIMKDRCVNRNIGCIVVLKGSAFGHGAVEVARYLKEHHPGLCHRLAVATVSEGIQLRQAHLAGPIHVLGNVQRWEMLNCVCYALIPTICSKDSVEGMAEILRNRAKIKSEITHWDVEGIQVGSVHIKLDTGLSRYGCNSSELKEILECCDSEGVPVEGIFTHLMWHGVHEVDNLKHQINEFETAIAPYRNRGYKLHVSSSAGTLLQIGTEYDFFRPGIGIFGQPQDLVDGFKLKPALAVKGTPTLLKQCLAGTKIGYGAKYECKTDEWIATFPIGCVDGYRRLLSSYDAYVVRDKTGERCPIVGGSSMDAMTVKVPCQLDPEETFTIIAADESLISIAGLSNQLNTIADETFSNLSPRLPRLYKSSLYQNPKVTPSLGVIDDKRIQELKKKLCN